MLVVLLAGSGRKAGVGAFPLDIELSVLSLALIVGDNQGLVMLLSITFLWRNDDGTIDLRGSSLGDQFGFARLFLGLEIERLVLLDLIGGEGLAILVNNLAGFGS